MSSYSPPGQNNEWENYFGPSESWLQQRDVPYGSPYRQKAHQCQHCSRSFDRPSSLAQHTFVHSGERPHLCRKCHAKRFATTSNLYRHERSCTGSAGRETSASLSRTTRTVSPSSHPYPSSPNRSGPPSDTILRYPPESPSNSTDDRDPIPSHRDSSQTYLPSSLPNLYPRSSTSTHSSTGTLYDSQQERVFRFNDTGTHSHHHTSSAAISTDAGASRAPRGYSPTRSMSAPTDSSAYSLPTDPSPSISASPLSSSSGSHFVAGGAGAGGGFSIMESTSRSTSSGQYAPEPGPPTGYTMSAGASMSESSNSGPSMKASTTTPSPCITHPNNNRSADPSSHSYPSNNLNDQSSGSSLSSSSSIQPPLSINNMSFVIPNPRLKFGSTPRGRGDLLSSLSDAYSDSRRRPMRFPSTREVALGSESPPVGGTTVGENVYQVLSGPSTDWQHNRAVSWVGERK